MTRPYLVDKPLGATPLQALHALREAAGLSSDYKLAYAGRLDPMATGLLLVLHDDLLKRQEEFWRLRKTYEASVVLGLSSDSHDSLGLPEFKSGRMPEQAAIAAAVRSLVGKVDLPIPAFSSYRIGGKPLFQLTRLESPVRLPVRRMVINEISLQGVDSMALSDIAESAIARCALVTGDFRQDRIAAAWSRLKSDATALPVVRMTVHCDSGTYIRSLAHELGRRLRSSGMLWELKRTVVGQYRLDDDAVIRFSWPR